MRLSTLAMVRAMSAVTGAALLMTALIDAQAKRKTDAQLKQQMIAASIAGYSGSCPCPYNSMRNGRRCGGRSAYSRPGGKWPLCYPDDISQKMVDAFRKQSRQ